MASSRPKKTSPRRPPSKRVAGRRTPAPRKRPRKSASRKRASRKKAPTHSWFQHALLWPFFLLGRLTHKWHPIFRYPTRALAGLGILGGTCFLLGAAIYLIRAVPFDMSEVARMPARTEIFDRNSKTMGRFHGENRYIVPIERVSPNFQDALLAREDKSFYKHWGVDPRGVARAAYENFHRGYMAQGASTITMQLARNAFHLQTEGPWYEQLDRKFLELAISFRIEAAYEKEEILEHYMNLIFWGGSIHGIESASRTYLEKSAADLTLSEGAMLAGIIRAPNAFSPFDDMKLTTRERDSTLASMVQHGFISQEKSDTAKKETLNIRPKHRRIIQGSYAMDSVRRELEEILAEKNIKQGGLKVTTTIDQNLQKACESALDKHLRSIERTSGYKHQTRAQWQAKPDGQRGDPAYIQGAVVIIENRTGAMLAVVGGRDADESQFNRAKYARRQIGSVFKPFVFLSAFNEGIKPETLVSDARIRPGQIDNAPSSWSPANSDKKYYASVKVREALIKSRNTSSVRVGDFAGMKNVAEVGRMAGFSKEIPNNPASYLGSWEASPWEVASAYTIFPNNGVRYRPYLIQKIETPDGQIVRPSEPLSYRAANTGAAWVVSKLLQEVTERGTAASMRSHYHFSRPAGGKTGTTDNYHDGWFVGYTSTLTCAVWVGLDRPKQTIPGGYGSRLALPIWIETMKTADRLNRYNFGSLNTDIPLSTCRLCNVSGLRATAGCEQHHTAYNTQVPKDLTPNGNELCTAHPARALPVTPNDTARGNRPPPRAIPVTPPPRAIPVE